MDMKVVVATDSLLERSNARHRLATDRIVVDINWLPVDAVIDAG